MQIFSSQMLFRFAVLPALLLFHAGAIAQWNFSTAYYAAFVQPNDYNTAIGEHNEQHPEYTSHFRSIKFIQGLEFGSRQRFEDVALTLTYQFAPKKLSAGDKNTSNTLQHTFHGFRFGVQKYFDAIVMGTSLDYNLLSVNQKFESPYVRQKYRASGFSSRFSIGYENNNSAGFGWSIRGYYQMMWKDLELNGYREGLGLDGDPDPLTFDNAHFGITLILFNGPQTR